MMIPATRDIDVEFDEETRSHFVVWQPFLVGSGMTQREALEDLRAAAHFGIDAMIDSELVKIKSHKEV
jgi:O-succinylbenzoate synthase